MPYIGNPIYQSAFVTDTFSGNGSTTAFTMSVAPAGVSNVLIAISGVLQDPATYGVVGNTLNFSQAPPTGTNNISCRYLGVPATGVTTTAYRTQTEFTATAGQTTFSVPSYTPGFIDVYRNGVLLASTNFVATNGTTVVLNNAASEGDLVETISFLVSSVLNAIPATAGSVGSSNIANGVTINFADGSASTPSITNDGDTNTGIFFPAADTIAFSEGGTESMRIDGSGNLGIGTSSPNEKLMVVGAGKFTGAASSLDQAGAFIDYSSNIARIAGQASTGGTLAFYTNPNAIFQAERMRIDSSGNLLVGTTTTFGGLSGITSASNFVVGTSAQYWKTTNFSSTYYFAFNGSDRATINGSTGAYTALSDANKKKDFEPSTLGLNAVMVLKPTLFRMIGDEESSDKQLGFLAQDVQSVIPQAYTEQDAPDGKFIGLQDRPIIAVLVKAIQEQQALITQLQADVAALKGATE